MAVFRLYGASLRQIRQELDLSQTEVARRSGVAVSTVNDLESERRRPSVEMLWRLAPALRTTPPRLLERLLAPPSITERTPSDEAEQRPERDSVSRKEAVS